MDKAVEFVLSCMNFDGGFGCRPGSESHAGQVLSPCLTLLNVDVPSQYCKRLSSLDNLNDHVASANDSLTKGDRPFRQKSTYIPPKNTRYSPLGLVFGKIILKHRHVVETP